MFSVFLLNYRNTCECLGELKKLWKHLPVTRVPKALLILLNFHSVSITQFRNAVHVYCFLMKAHLPEVCSILQAN